MLLVTALGSVSGGVFWTGVFFLTREHYGFSPAENLALALVMGTGYALVARSAGTIGAAFARLGVRRLVTLGFVAWAVASALPAFVHARFGIWLGAVLGASIPGVIWPVVESFLGGGRHGSELRRALGPFNLTWTLFTALPLLVFPWLTRVHALGPLLLCSVTNVAAALALALLPRRPAPPRPEHAEAAVGREYPALLVASRWLLPLSYLLLSTLSPILPHRLSELGLSADAALVAASWMVARFLTLGAMTILPFWHGRWGTLVAAAVALMAGVALTLLAGSLVLVVLGLTLFGAGLAATYFCSIYYSLAIGHAAVEAGGGFEALIGVGYMLGPIVGLCGRALPGGPEGTGTVALAWGVALLGGALAARPYFAARRARRRD
ncbi:MAG TPA: hypothetical protein VMI54_27500 [Polyangiaceae bacterium]|nr:hypothetical protein [Polyangiaceae bacterium]